VLQRLFDITENRFPRSFSKIQQLLYGYQTYGIVSFF
jgi:hypothetical protein